MVNFYVKKNGQLFKEDFMNKEFTLNILDLYKFQSLVNNILHNFFVTSFPERDIFAACKFYIQDNQFLFDINLKYFDVVLGLETGNLYFNYSVIHFVTTSLNKEYANFCCMSIHTNDAITLLPTKDYRISMEKIILDYLF